MPAKLDKTDEDLKHAIAQRFKELRLATGKTQQDFAYEAGRDKQSYSKNERGKGATIYTIHKFCLEHNISLSHFFDSELFNNSKKKKRI